MTKKVLLSLLLCMIISFSLYSQGEPNYREMFLEAESYFLFEEYNEALPLYLRLNEKFPENENIISKKLRHRLNHYSILEMLTGSITRSIKPSRLTRNSKNSQIQQFMITNW